MFSRLLILFSFCVVISSCEKATDTLVTGCTVTASAVVVPAAEMDSLRGMGCISQTGFNFTSRWLLLRNKCNRRWGRYSQCMFCGNSKICRLFNRRIKVYFQH